MPFVTPKVAKIEAAPVSGLIALHTGNVPIGLGGISVSMEPLIQINFGFVLERHSRVGLENSNLGNQHGHHDNCIHRSGYRAGICGVLRREPTEEIAH